MSIAAPGRRFAHPGMIGMTTLLGIMGGASASGGELKLSTVRIDLADSSSNIALTVTNVGAAASLVQFRVMAWSQLTGEDSLTVTRDLIANPPMVEIPAGAAQIVRIGYNGHQQQASETCYRLLVEEVPKKDREQSQTVETYLKLSVPVFVAPLAGSAAVVPPTLSIGPGQDGKPALLVHNPDIRHLRITGYRLADQAGHDGKTHSGLFYALPGATTALPLDPADPKPEAASRAVLVTDSPTPQSFSLSP